MKNNVRINIATAIVFILFGIQYYKNGFILDVITLILFFSGICIFLLPKLAKFKVLGVLELEKIQTELNEVKITLYKGKVVKDERSNLYFIDKMAVYHLLPDIETANFLETSEGQIEIERKELKKKYTEGEKLDSVLLKSSQIVWVNERDTFIILNGKRFYIPNWDYLYKWDRTNIKEIEKITPEELRNRYPEGR